MQVRASLAFGRRMRTMTETAITHLRLSEIINIAEPAEEGSERPTRRPRIIYIRDFPTLASSSSSWYPALLAAIRERRQGALAKLNSPILYPTTIIFGATPGITQHQPRSQAHDSATSSSSRSKAKKVHAEHSEDDVVDKAREKRLRDRLRKWEKDDTLHEEFPRLQNNGESSDGPSLPSGGYMVLDSPDAIPSALNQIFSRLGGSATRLSSFSSGKDQPGHFFRTSVVIPSTRSLLKENASRMFRRRELNELSMRMAVASVGGTLGRLEVEGSIEEDSLLGKMWTEWGRSVETWANTRHIADLVVGQATRALHEDVLSGSVSSLDATPVEWPQVFEAWTTYKGLKDSRKAWVKQSTEKTTLPEEGEEDAKEEDGVDEVVERIRKEAEDGDLDDYEEKLLGCIVDTGTISTTFNKVHLPPHTIDSVRTIVSLPLLHPDAFSHGILKEHSMTGCLLFGPPGTGKTLLVRALAKEAGCRMLAITPSDVMDMYVGEAEKAVRAVFTLARRLAPCVVFIDELDALFGARSSGSMSGGDHAHRGVITEFMQEMDGLTSSKDDNIMVIGATNRPFDLDDAVLRRLPRRLLIDLPGEKEREEILKILLRDETLEENVDTKVLAQKTETFSGSDLKHLCVSAALDSVKERVDVPWKSQSQPQAHTEGPVETKVAATEEASGASAEPTEPTTKPPRTLAWHNFEAALKEITPSSSEHLGTLADLRKWNQEFGEGRRERKKQVWGKDRFGFTIETLQKGDSTVQVGIPAGSATSTSDTR
ncbi:hypothetical protein EUX98_g233 [Antrodiella citrinella]|uniref:AAA+ ATPase domain-containing protein n=1 Tax=Antrodiella citrinella TaxID=2447956 RepID=A0A4S4N5Z4_9APHY|nr:hypothetical protein EUX98_g233 [Antrodiella citrinella]